MNSTFDRSINAAPIRAISSADAGVRKGWSLETIWTVLRFTFGLVPIVAGLDKFSNILVDWESYLNPAVLRLMPISGHLFMEVAGVIEIIAGIIVLARPRFGGYLVAAWLVCISISLIASGRYFDVAVRDVVMAVGALTLANLTPLVRHADYLERRSS